MGGTESLLTGLNSLDLFAWIGAFSAGGMPEDHSAWFSQVTAADNRNIRLLWMACGTEDAYITPNRELWAWFDARGIRSVKTETPGTHAWTVCRRDLVAFAPLLFAPPPKR